MTSGYRIRTIDVTPGLVLSPMSGVTTSAFRRLLKELNPGALGLVISEFVSVEGLTRESRRSFSMLKFVPAERPYGVQIFGYDPVRMRDAARMVEDTGADLVDINCGCPAPKVVKRGGGCELMRQPEHLARIIRAVKSAVSIPVTLKIRSGWDEDSKNAMQVARAAVDEGIEALAVHGRTRAQLYRGSADWSFARELAAALPIPVCGSGDVVDKASALERLATGVSGLFIGRAAIWNPFVFSEIHDGVSRNLAFDQILMCDVLLRYCELLEEDFPPQSCVGKVKQLTSQMARGASWKKSMLIAKTYAEQREILLAVRAGTWSNRGVVSTAEQCEPEKASACSL